MRPLLILITLAVPALASAQSDSVPPPATAPSTEDFRPGQWAVRFIANGSLYGAGALYFTAPRSAWLLEGYLNATYQEQNGESYNGQSATVLAGKRWYGERHGRVRSIRGFGGVVGFGRSYYTSTDAAAYAYAGGLYGELGAALMFTPNLSLGATWRANLGATYYDQGNDQTNYYFNAGPMAIEGAFYF